MTPWPHSLPAPGIKYPREHERNSYQPIGTSMNIFRHGPRGVQSLQMVLFNCSNSATSPPPPPAGFALTRLALRSRSPSGVRREPYTGASCSLGNMSGTSHLVMVMHFPLTASRVGNKNVPSRKGHRLLARREHHLPWFGWRGLRAC